MSSVYHADRVLILNEGILVLLDCDEFFSTSELEGQTIHFRHADYGMELAIGDVVDVPLTEVLMQHLIETRTTIQFFDNSPNLYVSDFLGEISFDRDALVRAHGAWLYSRELREAHQAG